MTANKREFLLHCCFQTIPSHVVNIANPPSYWPKNLTLAKKLPLSDKITASLQTNMYSRN